MPRRSQSLSPGLSPVLEARLLGGCDLRYRGREVPASNFKRQRSLTLLLMLLSQPGHRMLRSQVLEFLWPDSNQQQSEGSLRVVLSRLR